MFFAKFIYGEKKVIIWERGWNETLAKGHLSKSSLRIFLNHIAKI